MVFALDGASEDAFYRIPPEIWEKIVSHLRRRELNAFTRVSRKTYPHANILLYKSVELSFCKCSQTYYDVLSRTITTKPNLAALVTEFLIDMKIPCRIKTAGSMENVKGSTFSWKKQIIARPLPLLFQGNIERHTAKSSAQKGKIEWNREALHTLRKPSVSDIVSHLVNLKHVTVIMGRYEDDPELLSSILSMIPADAMRNLEKLKIYDAPLTKSTSLFSLTRLRSLNLGYVSVTDSELCSVIAQNADTLEELRLAWIVSSEPLLRTYPESTLRKLRMIEMQGPQGFESDGLRRLLSGVCHIEEFALDSLSALGAITWSQLITEFVDSAGWSFQNMRRVRFGAPIGCTPFWDSVSHLLGACGDGIECLHINGSPKGANANFPMSLNEYFVNHTQPDLKDVVIIWRDNTGFPSGAMLALGKFCPSAVLLHLYVQWPYNHPDGLVDQLTVFKELKRLHLVFLKNVSGTDASNQVYARAMNRATADIAGKGVLFQNFVEQAAASHQGLAEVSWSVYDRSTFTTEPHKAYARIKRSHTTNPIISPNEAHQEGARQFVLDDLGAEIRKYDRPQSLPYRCLVGQRKVLLSQKPSWREEMGNSFLETRRICPRADFETPEQVYTRNREL